MRCRGGLIPLGKLKIVDIGDARHANAGFKILEHVVHIAPPFQNLFLFYYTSRARKSKGKIEKPPPEFGWGLLPFWDKRATGYLQSLQNAVA
jgi:hypothetical protein